ncbi:hypothetical protein B0487_2088 [Bifidobacterium adolescentis]|uniref:Uncharacterized protein n=1 Tax=Bifidobacterium adolescentis TaxID=1680 RepID=A0A1X2YRX9_BIFAD|nr:hypothetical protein [Bifidobacterium adolescentis]OSG84601.1 hypothetical protein B0487_2088 [Bifidobacterium adolescentis]
MNQKVLITLNNGAKRIVYRDDLCHELADLLRLYLHADASPGTGERWELLRTLASTLIGRAVEKGLFEVCARVNVYPVSFQMVLSD